MALEHKDIVITPNRGSSAANPNIVFTSDANSSITLVLTSSNGGTLTFSGNIGALLSLVDTSTGTLFGINDGSGIPSFEVIDDGTVKIAQYGGNVGIGTGSPAYKLDVVGTVRASAITSTTITGGNASVSSLGIGTAASGTIGEIRATNNITAYYSDDRFKTNLGNIPDALSKVLSLNGFYYEANALAQSYGYEVKREIGVSAQEVQSILPEIVAPAPIDENFLTVRYERLVPLLIEAVKELSAQVDELRKQHGDCS